jgi:hypothetical protein
MKFNVYAFKVLAIQWIEKDPYVTYFKPYTLNPSLTYRYSDANFLPSVFIILSNVWIQMY